MNTFILSLSERLIKVGVMFFISIIAALYLEKQKFGELNFVLQLYPIALCLCSVGLQGGAFRDISKRKESLVVVNVLIIRIIAGGLLCCLGWLTAVVTSYDESWLLAILLVGCVFHPYEVFDYYFKAWSDYKTAAVLKIAAYLVSAGAKLVSIIFYNSIFYFVAAHVLESLLILIMFFIMYNKESVGLYKKATPWRYFVENITEARSLFISSLILCVYMRIDIFVIDAIVGVEKLAEYSLVLKFVDGANILIIAFLTSVVPGMVRIKSDDKLYYDSLKVVFSNVILLSFSSFFFVLFVAETILYVLFKEDYFYQTLGYLWLMCCFIPVFYFKSLFIRILHLEHLGSINLKLHILCLIINILLSCILTYFFGVLGAVIGTLITGLLAIAYLLLCKELLVYKKAFLFSLSNPFYGVGLRRVG